MNRFIYFVCIMLCLAVASCDDGHSPALEGGDGTGGSDGTDQPGKPDGEDTPQEPAVSFWEHTHLAFTGLKGVVDNVKETIYVLPDGAEPYITELLDMSFDAEGRMTFYNSTGQQVPTRGWGPEMNSYAYEYDDLGNMVRATVTPVGDAPVTYNLTYGEHAVYVPLLFPLGPMEFFLVKGLQSIVSEDGAVAYTFDGETASLTESGWAGSTQTVYAYAAGSPYPSEKRVTTTRGGTVLSEETTRYTYGEEGRLLKTDVRMLEHNGESLSESMRTVTVYAEELLLQPASVMRDIAGGFTQDYAYTYDAGNNRLLQVAYAENKGAPDEVTAKEEYNYLAADNNGNWTDSKQLQSGLVDWKHVDGWVGVRRRISYHR